MDNRISRYSMKLGKCEITGMYLFVSDVHCHHYIPLQLGGSDKFNNIRILHKEVHKLVMMEKINIYREKCGLEPIQPIPCP
ncbi:MAG: group intron reverse transcriptase/maturase [Paenibacillus sp.]|nr:group intron reverse transcriptase/maturase [Paenibacillus sp.]